MKLDDQGNPIEDKAPEPNAELDALKAQLADQAQIIEQNRAVIEEDKERRAKASAEQARQEADLKAQTEQSLRSNNKYKDLVSIKDKELAEKDVVIQEMTSKRESDAQAIAKTFKNNAKRTAALKAGVRDDSMALIDMMPDKGIELRKTESGTLDVTGADEWMESVKADHPSLFKSATPPNLAGNRPSSSTAKSTKINLLELEKSDPEQYKIEMTRLIKDQGVPIK